MTSVIAPSYIELQVTTNFSFLHGASHPAEFIAQAKELGYQALAITDRNSLAGIVRAHEKARALNFPLIVGARVDFQETLSPSAKHLISLLLYPTSITGYGNLCELLSRGKCRAPKGECYLTLADLVEFEQDLLAVIVIETAEDPRLQKTLAPLVQMFSDDRLSLALHTLYRPNDERITQQLVALATRLDLPLVATNDAHYHNPSRRLLQDVLTCVRLGKTLDTAGFALYANSERYLKPPSEMARLFREFPRAVSRTKEITTRALSFSLSQLRYEYPHEVVPPGKAPAEYLKELTWQGARERYPTGVPDPISMQIGHELALISELRYEKYFLTVYDIVAFARSRGILCQGRGAAANSAVCYCLGITAVDPDRIQLLFERFISRERNEPPDIDIDFEHERREEVIQYLYEKYSRHRAALVSEVITYRARSAVRDVGKVFGLSLDCIAALTKALDYEEKEGIPARTLKQHGIDPTDQNIRHVVALTKTLLSFPRHLSQHVGGMVITEGPLSRLVPIENAAMPGRTIIEWDKDDIEIMGMLKIDLLGLGMLTCLRKAFALINKHAPGQNIALHTIPAEDTAVYDMICQADTVGVFQIESRAQMSMLPRLRPRNFYDLVIEIAIIRPGPIQGGMVHPYLRRKHGEETVSYPSPAIEQILGRTLGVPIFQEQVMQLAVVAAGFTPGEADNLRRVMASWKRNGTLLETFGKRLLDGMLGNGYSLQFAQTCLSQIKGFAEYGFPQSHAASFALLAYASAWVKYHYPTIYTAALLNSQPMGFYAPAQIIRDLKEHGGRVLPIDVNFSQWDSTTAENKTEENVETLRLGLRLVKGLTKKEALRLITTTQQHGPYYSLAKLWRESGVPVSTLRQLAAADAFSSLDLSRERALWELKRFREERLPLFDGYEEKEPALSLPELSLQEQVISDYAITGFSLKAHPMSFLRSRLAACGVIPCATLSTIRAGAVSVSGLVLVRQRPHTASGIVFMTIEDETGIANLIIRPNIYQEFRDTVRTSGAIIASGFLQRQGAVIHILVSEVSSLDHLFQEFSLHSRDFH